MFEDALIAKLKKIFDLKVSMDLSQIKFSDKGYSGEQETLFVEILSSMTKIKDAREVARVNGKCTVFANGDKLPFGYFNKQIDLAGAECADLFFHDLEGSVNVFGKLVQRSFSFVYFFNGQYNPEVGTMTSINIEQVIE